MQSAIRKRAASPLGPRLARHIHVTPGYVFPIHFTSGDIGVTTVTHDCHIITSSFIVR